MYSSFRIFYKSNLKIFWFIPPLLCWDKIYQSFLQILLLLKIWTEHLLSTVCLIALLSSLHASCLFILPLADKHRPCSRGLSRGPLLTQTALPGCTGLSRGLRGEESTCQHRRCLTCRFDAWMGEPPGGGSGNLIQYSCLENSKDRGAWQATVHGVAELDTTEHTRMSLIHNIINSGQDIFKRSNFFLRSISDQYFSFKRLINFLYF